ncbi:MAG: Uma2 family endonuclease [Spirochaetaceae bacterium]|nr:MAG: Uma2 family endonuclease [Spirochaetaceae bacterium]
MSVTVAGTTKLTYDEYLHFPDDGRRHEIIDGEHYVSPAPSTDHQNVSRHIQYALYRQLEERGRAQVFNAPVDVELSPTDVVQPDLAVVLTEHSDRILRSRLRGAPDLVVEIASPSTAERDRTLKLALYARHRVPEYWIVDSEKRCVAQYRLQSDGGYDEPDLHEESIAFADAVVDLTDVWRRL